MGIVVDPPELPWGMSAHWLRGRFCDPQLLCFGEGGVSSRYLCCCNGRTQSAPLGVE